MGDPDEEILIVRLGEDPGRRLDKALAAVVPAQSGLSRSRIAELIQSGAVRGPDGAPLTSPSARPRPGQELTLRLPPAVPMEARPQALPLDVVFEDPHLIVVNKPAGMVVHPAAGSPDGTLVNVLLHHCAGSLSGIGGTQRPGIVHRIDKDTSGLLVVAKSDTAHQGLAAQFALHTVRRAYDGICWGVPRAGDPRLQGLPGVLFSAGAGLTIDLPLARHRSDRKKMAVQTGGKHAVTHVTVEESLGDAAARLTCRLETGRTHQIRVHMAHVGHPLLGDPTYGRNRRLPPALADRAALAGFKRQALHARSLGFCHPVTGADLDFEAPTPADMLAIAEALRIG